MHETISIPCNPVRVLALRLQRINCVYSVFNPFVVLVASYVLVLNELAEWFHKLILLNLLCILAVWFNYIDWNGKMVIEITNVILWYTSFRHAFFELVENLTWSINCLCHQVFMILNPWFVLLDQSFCGDDSLSLAHRERGVEDNVGVARESGAHPQ